MATFQIKLFQTERINTEVFTVEAADEKAAKAEADKIAADKGLKKNFDFEFENLTAKEQAENPTEPEVR